MTLEQLECIYNFHDCDVFTPFSIEGDSITVIFDLAKHLQYDTLKSRYGDLLKNKEHNLIVKVKFSNCSDLQVSEWEDSTSKTINKNEKHNEKTIPIEQFDTDMDFISLAILDGNEIHFPFERCGKSKKYSEIRFVCHNVEVIEEKIYSASEYDKLW